jgi:lipopolysaccharide exporter
LSEHLARKTGSALFWQTTRLAGSKVTFLVRTLVLARLLAPEDFGLLAVSMIAVDLLVHLTETGMVPALIQRSDVDERHYHSAWTLGILRALGVTATIYLAAPLIAGLFAQPQATPLIRVLAVHPLLEAAASIRVVDLHRTLRFRSLTLLQVGDAVVNTVVAIALAPLLGVWALVISALASPIFHATVSYILAPYRPRLVLDREAASSLIRYGRWIFLTSLIAVSGGSMIQLAISRRLGVAELGLYAMAGKLAFVPYEVSSGVLQTVAFPMFAQLQTDTQRLEQTFRIVWVSAAAFLWPVCTLIIALAPSLVVNILGPRWQGTVPLIRWLALVNVLGLFGDVTAPIFKALAQPYRITVVEMLQSALLITLIWGLAGRYGVTGAALARLIAVGSSQLVSAAFLLRVLPRPFDGIGLPMALIAAVCGIVGLAVSSADRLIVGPLGFLLAILSATTAMVLLIWFLDRRFRLGLANNLARAFPQIASLAGYASTDS